MHKKIITPTDVEIWQTRESAFIESEIKFFKKSSKSLKHRYNTQQESLSSQPL